MFDRQHAGGEVLHLNAKGTTKSLLLQQITH